MTIKSNMLLSIKCPGHRRLFFAKQSDFVDKSGRRERFVEAEAGDIGGLDDVGVIVPLFGEGDGEVLDAVFDPKSFEEDDVASKMFDEVVVAFVGFDVA